MVEFDSLEAATRARENLNGADIYSGCCTLKIDYAKPEKLNVYKNEPDTSWDYTLTAGEFKQICIVLLTPFYTNTNTFPTTKYRYCTYIFTCTTAIPKKVCDMSKNKYAL
ncbi:unnamed protein product [Ceratitis capitata]|uniref:(Mediterranean fruit fly) hypothetical protein n=1 Tax=Ceratitis capitata TaxID=7213 RepID=A0A811V6X4_CERCA|nr:unnamed protein product [Ceratitis capitata]